MSDVERIWADEVYSRFGWRDADPDSLGKRQQLIDALKSGRVSAWADNAILTPMPPRERRYDTPECEVHDDWAVDRTVWSAAGLNLGARRYKAKLVGRWQEVELTGLRFSLPDIVSALGWVEVVPAREGLANVYAEPDPDLGRLPPNAKPADRRYAPFAHEAAALVRKGAQLSSAIRQVAKPMPPLADSSVEHGIRRTFVLMYSPDGRAIQP